MVPPPLADAASTTGGCKALRASAHGAGSSRRSSVAVNTRALVDKTLARYVAAFAIYRELLQNAEDAGASSAVFCFTTAPADNEAWGGGGV